MGKSFSDSNLEEMDAIWDQVKKKAQIDQTTFKMQKKRKSSKNFTKAW